MTSGSGSAQADGSDAIEDFDALRISYGEAGLEEADLADTPLAQFSSWFADTVAAGVSEPNAMVLATADATGQPSARTVLLKDVDRRGFVFYTNDGSRKGRDLQENPRASLVFSWRTLHRQVIVVGRAERVSRQESAEYFATRPHDSQLGAWASRQSAVLDGRAPLEAEYARLAREYPGEVPLPDFWGGWLVRPMSVEFWKGRTSRLHDRLRFRAVGDQPPALDDATGWLVERLSP